MKRHLFSLFLLVSLSCNPDRSIDRAQEIEKSESDNPSVPDRDDSLKDGRFNLSNFQQLVKKYEDPERANWQNPELILAKLGDLNGQTVADIGAGTGYFTFRMAEKGATVIAIDIDHRFLDYIDERKIELQGNIANQVITRLVEEDDPKLRIGEVDIAILVNTYHFLTDRPAYLTKISKGLKSSGKIIIVDYKEGELPVGPSSEYRIPPEQVRAEIEQAGMKVLEIDNESLTYQYIITARP